MDSLYIIINENDELCKIVLQKIEDHPASDYKIVFEPTPYKVSYSSKNTASDSVSSVIKKNSPTLYFSDCDELVEHIKDGNYKKTSHRDVYLTEVLANMFVKKRGVNGEQYVLSSVQSHQRRPSYAIQTFTNIFTPGSFKEYQYKSLFSSLTGYYGHQVSTTTRHLMKHSSSLSSIASSSSQLTTLNRQLREKPVINLRHFLDVYNSSLSDDTASVKVRSVLVPLEVCEETWDFFGSLNAEQYLNENSQIKTFLKAIENNEVELSGQMERLSELESEIIVSLNNSDRKLDDLKSTIASIVYSEVQKIIVYETIKTDVCQKELKAENVRLSKMIDDLYDTMDAMVIYTENNKYLFSNRVIFDQCCLLSVLLFGFTIIFFTDVVIPV